MKARYYDPVAMRFISPDPVYVDLSTGGNFNRYWYANNNPYTFVDPDGRQANSDLGTYIGARIHGQTHSEALRTMRGTQEVKMGMVKSALEITAVGGAIDAAEITAELVAGNEPVDKAVGAVSGDVVSEVAERVLDKRVGSDAARLIGGVLGKVVGDSVESGVRDALTPTTESVAPVSPSPQELSPKLDRLLPIGRNEMIDDKPR